jgi:tricorn protease interacting factor F2/3
MKPLNKNILPTNYNLHFNLTEDNNFSGEETISLESTKDENKILLNAKNIKITKTNLNNQEIPLKNISYKEDIITINTTIPKGIAKLKITFQGQYGHVTGLYKSQYKDGFMFTTQFEAAHAREAFPCIDEPIAKATFDVKITTNKPFEAISNTKIIKKETNKETITYIFDTSPKMSTYLLYLGAGKFDKLEEMFQNKRIRIITVPGKAKKFGKFAMTATKQFLTYFENYFGIKYPLDKLDMIAVPDFGSGAMENWGAVTFREDALLYNPKSASLSAKQRVAEVISHELVHQWFGNLVTMKWWNDLWLNESFADYMAYKAVAHYYPEMDPWADFLNSRVSGAYFLDSLDNSHPINVNVKSPIEIREVFDAISYSKGGMVLRMLENYIGEESFKQGLHQYLSKNSYSNAEGNDLWHEIAQFTDKPVEKMMDNWLNQMGFPLVEASLNVNKLKLSQKRFQFVDKKDNKTWLIPIAIDHSYILMEDKSMEIERKNWLKVNKGQTGFYRVKYSPELTEELKKSFNKFDKLDVWGLYNDFFALCLATEIDLNNYLDMIKLYKDQDYIVVSEVLSNLTKLEILNYSRVKEVSENFCNILLKKFGWDKKKSEKETDGTLRSTVIGKLGILGNKDVLKKINELFKKFLQDQNSIDPDMKSTIYKLTAWQGNEKTYKQLLDLYKKSEDPQQQVQLLASLAYFKEESLLKKSLDLALSGEVRHQNIIYLIANMCRNPYGRNLVWPWVKSNYGKIKNIYSHYVWHFNSTLGNLSLLADPKLGKEIKTFLEKDPIPGTQRALAQMLEKMDIYEKFLKSIN